MKTSGIYKIQSTIKPERIYVGSAVNLYNRWRCHKSLLNLNKHTCKKLQNHFNKYGESDLEYSVIICCEKNDLIKHEQFFIDSLNPYFNIAKIAGSTMGLKWKLSPQRVAQLRQSASGRVVSEETRQKMSIAKKGKPSHFKGKKTTEEAKEKQRISHKGCSGWNKGLKATPEACLHQSESHLGRKRPPFTEETKQKMRKPKSAEHRASISKGQTGRTASDETRRKQSESAKRRFERQRLLKQAS